MQEVRWEGGGTQPAEEYTCFLGKGNEDHELGTGFLCVRESYQQLRTEFVSDRMSYIILRGRWCHIIVLNVHAPTEDKTDDVKDSFYEELECVFHTFRKYHMKILLGDFIAKVGREEVQTAEQLVLGPSRLEVKIAIAKLKKHKSPAGDLILVEPIQSGGKILLSVTHKLINSVWNKEGLPDQWKESIIVPIHKKGDKTDRNNHPGISLLSTSYKILSNILLSRLRLR
jgi:hypothetical protein